MILPLVLIAFLALAAGVSIRWVLHRVDGLGRVRAFPRISVGLCLAVVLACAVPMVLHARLESRLASAASTIAGQRVEVHCQTFGQAFVDAGMELGWVSYGTDGVPEHSTLIKRSPCGELSAWLRSSKLDPSLDQVIAVHVLTHETMHMVGITNEAQAECAAIQRDATMATVLGATPLAARALAQRYWLEAYPRMRDEYRGGCGEGGAFDEQLAGAPWADQP